MSENTIRTNRCALRTYSKYLSSKPSFSYYGQRGSKADNTYFFLGNIRTKLSMKIFFFRDNLSEFATHNQKGGGTEILPSTMMRYLLSFNRVLKNIDIDINFQTHPKFTDKNHRLIRLLDNTFAVQQTQGVHVVYPKILPRVDIVTVLNHNVCSMLQSTRYLSSLILIVKVLSDNHLRTMVELTLNQFYYNSLNGKKVVTFMEEVE